MLCACYSRNDEAEYSAPLSPACVPGRKNERSQEYSGRVSQCYTIIKKSHPAPEYSGCVIHAISLVDSEFLNLNLSNAVYMLKKSRIVKEYSHDLIKI